MTILSMLMPIGPRLLIAIAITVVIILVMARSRRTMLKVCIGIYTVSFIIGFIIFTLAYLPDSFVFAEILWLVLRAFLSTVRMFSLSDS